MPALKPCACERKRQWEAALRLKLKAKGICIRCREQKDDKGVRCRMCRDIQNAENRRRYEARKLEGMCTNCGADPLPDHCLCLECKLAKAERAEKRKRRAA